MRLLALLLILILAPASRTSAQPTNLELFQALALECVAFLSDSGEDILLDAPARMPYVRSAIVSHLLQEDRQVFLADSVYAEKPNNLPTFSYKIDQARVDYKRLKKGRVRRTLEFSTATLFVSSEGQLLKDEICNKQTSDTVSAANLASLESSVYSETRGPELQAGFFRRVFQPIVLTAATVLTVYLFFTLRSDSSSDGN